MNLSAIKTLFLGIFLLTAYATVAQEAETLQEELQEENKFDPQALIMHHIKDAYGFHIIDIGEKQYSISLPIILWTDNGLVTFMSSAFDHDYYGNVVVERNGMRFVNYKEKIYQLNAGETALVKGEDGNPTNAVKPILDISVTKNVFMMWVSVLVLFLIFIGAARKYKKSESFVPKGIASFVEPLILFVRDEVAKPMIGEKKYERYMPYLLTVFFFIWLNNVFGLIPIVNAANLTGNIAFTMTMALFTFLITTFSGNKHYWKHIFWMPGVPVPMKIFLAPIELVGIFTKPISLMIRLFANITAGHIIVLSLMSLIFIFKSLAVAPVSVAFSLFIIVIEIVVTAIQAYIFTILSALYIGMAVEEHEHH